MTPISKILIASSELIVEKELFGKSSEKNGKVGSGLPERSGNKGSENTDPLFSRMRPGQNISAKVLDLLPGNRSELLVLGKKIIAKAPFPLRPGEEITLTVSGTPERPSLKITGDIPLKQEQAIYQAVRNMGRSGPYESLSAIVSPPRDNSQARQRVRSEFKSLVNIFKIFSPDQAGNIQKPELPGNTAQAKIFPETFKGQFSKLSALVSSLLPDLPEETAALLKDGDIGKPQFLKIMKELAIPLSRDVFQKGNSVSGKPYVDNAVRNAYAPAHEKISPSPELLTRIKKLGILDAEIIKTSERIFASVQEKGVPADANAWKAALSAGKELISLLESYAGLAEKGNVQGSLESSIEKIVKSLFSGKSGENAVSGKLAPEPETLNGNGKKPLIQGGEKQAGKEVKTFVPEKSPEIRETLSGEKAVGQKTVVQTGSSAAPDDGEKLSKTVLADKFDGKGKTDSVQGRQPDPAQIKRDPEPLAEKPGSVKNSSGREYLSPGESRAGELDLPKDTGSPKVQDPSRMPDKAPAYDVTVDKKLPEEQVVLKPGGMAENKTSQEFMGGAVRADFKAALIRLFQEIGQANVPEEAPKVDTGALRKLLEDISLSSSRADHSFIERLVEKGGLSFEKRLLSVLSARDTGTWPVETDRVFGDDLKGTALKMLFSAGDDSEEWAGRLKGFVDSLEKLQLVNRMGMEDSGRFLLNVPVAFDQEFRFGQLLIDLGEPGARKKGAKSPLRIAFLLEMSALGDVRADFNVSGKRISGHFGVSDIATANLIREHIPELKDKLEEQGFSVYGIDSMVLGRDAFKGVSLADEIGDKDSLSLIV